MARGCRARRPFTAPEDGGGIGVAVQLTPPGTMPGLARHPGYADTVSLWALVDHVF
jgi:hypothetical protein